MLFLIEYDRNTGKLKALDRFGDDQRLEANSARLARELDLNGRRIDHEVVLLEASNEDALRRTHRRYFEDPESLSGSLPTQGKKVGG